MGFLLALSAPPPKLSTEATPPPVIILGVRVPANGTSPSLLYLTTTTDGVASSTSSFLFRVPDMRSFWAVPQAWKYQDVHRIELRNQPFEECDRVYMIFHSFAPNDLPQNAAVPLAFAAAEPMWGDVFVVKLAPEEWGGRMGGWFTRIFRRGFGSCQFGWTAGWWVFLEWLIKGG